MKTWKRAFNLLIPFQALPLAWKHLMLSICGSYRGKNPKDKQRSSYTRFLNRKRKELPLGHSTDQAIRTCSGHKTKPLSKGLIFSETRSLIRWMSPYNLRNWRLWMMYWRPSMKKRERRRSCGIRRKTSATWWRRMQARGRGSSRRRMGNRKRRNSSSREITTFSKSLSWLRQRGRDERMCCLPDGLPACLFFI